MKHQQTKSDR